jgi:putative transposase
VKLDFIRPGKPIENAEIESFHGRPRQEFLKENWFMSLEDAKMKIKTGARTATSTGPTAV